MKKIKSKELLEYENYLNLEASKFRLTAEDLTNLYDLLDMVDTPEEINIDMRKTLKLNKMNKWFNKFQNRLDKIVIPELKK